MPPVTIEALEAKQADLAAEIQQFKAQTQVRVIQTPGCAIELRPGERYAGAKLDENGSHRHHVIVMAARPEKRMAWQAALDWAVKQGGEAPSPEEYALIKANCADVLPDVSWTNKPHQDSSYPWYFYSNGYTLSTHKSAELSVLVVRRA